MKGAGTPKRAGAPGGMRRLVSRLRRGIRVAACGLMGGLVGSAAAAEPARDVPLILTQLPAGAELDAAGLPDYEGARVVRVEPDGTLQILSSGFHTACDPAVSFDAGKMLFAAREHAGSQWRIYEMAPDGTGSRPLTPESLDARSAIYVSTLFTLDSPQPWFTVVFVGTPAVPVGQALSAIPSLYNIKLDGGELRRLTWSPHSSRDPYQMWDGRVIYAGQRGSLMPATQNLRSSLFATHIEGADTELYGGELGGRWQRSPCATETGLTVFVESESAPASEAGQLACVDEARPHATYRRLTADPGRSYAQPFPWAGSRLLVASRPAQAGKTWEIALFDTAPGTTTPLFDDPDFHDLQPRLLQPRRRPDGHSTVVNTEAVTGVFYGLNCYTADPRLAAHLRPGEVKRVRFVEGVLESGRTEPEGAAAAQRTSRRLVGEAPVAPDGSFNVEVPASTPLLLQTLDERGLALATCGWVWVQPKETRGCIGCHEDPELIPENEYVQALRQRPVRLTLPPEQRRVLSFRDDIAPMLGQRCALADCHGGAESHFRLPLSGDSQSPESLEDAYRVLTRVEGPSSLKRPLVSPGVARTSVLVWHLFGRDTSRPWDREAGNGNPGGPALEIKLMPPPGKAPQLTPEEIHTVVQWIDMGAPFGASSNAALAASRTTLPQAP